MPYPLRIPRSAPLLLLACAAAQAHVTVTADRPILRSRQECVLRAELPGGPPRTWRWSLRGPATCSPALIPISDAEARFSAPLTQAGATFTVVVEAADNPSIRGECQLRVRPNPRLRPGPGDPAETLAAGSSRPGLSRLAGDPAAHPRTPQPLKLAFCHEAFASGPDALRRLGRRWLLADPEGLRAFSPGGRPMGLALEAPGCRAVATLPPGDGPRPARAPALVAGLADEAGTRILALGIDGLISQRAAFPGRTVEDLALDRHGAVFVAFRDDPAVWRVDPSGAAAPHARIPEAAGLLALALDPATGDLHAGVPGGLWRISPEGAVTRLARLGAKDRPAHLALRGRELLFVDTRRQELRVLPLDRPVPAVLAGSASRRGLASARLGPLQGIAPEGPLDPCAALHAAGPLALAGDGLGLLVLGDGLASLDLPEGPLALAADPPAPAPKSARQKSLEHFRRLQAEIRAYKRAQREARRQEREPEAGAGPAPVTLRAPASPALPHAGGLFCLTLLGLGALSDPSLLGALAQGPAFLPPLNLTATVDRYAAEATASLDHLGASCGAALLAGRHLAPCTADYRQSLRAQVVDIHGRMRRLFVDPALLGAGDCYPGEPRRRARERLALAQSDNLAAFDELGGASSTLAYQLTRDGFVLLAAGRGLFAGQALASGTGTAPGATAAFALGSAANGLSALGAGVQATGSVFAKIANLALTYRARYQRWANSQGESLLNCTRAAAPGPPPLPPPDAALRPFAPDASPAAALSEALDRLATGCALAQRHLLDLPVCSPESIGEFGTRTAAASDLFQQGIACLSTGILRGRQATCPLIPLSDARSRSDTLAFFDQFTGEVSAAGYDALAAGNSLAAAAVGLREAGAVALRAGDPTRAADLVASAASLEVLANSLLANGADLLRIGGLARRWEAETTLAFNVESRQQLEQRERREWAEAHASSTAAQPPEPMSTGSPAPALLEPPSTGAPAPGLPEPGGGATAAPVPEPSRAALPAPVASPAPLPAVPEPPAPEGASTGATASLANSAARTRPFTLRDLLGLQRLDPREL